MQFGSVMNAFVAVFLIIPLILLFLALRRFFWVKGVGAKIPDPYSHCARFLRCRKTAASTSGDDQWGQAFETGPAFTDSWDDASRQDEDIRLAFTDHALCRYSQENGQGASR